MERHNPKPIGQSKHLLLVDVAFAVCSCTFVLALANVPKGARQMRFQCSEIVILAKRHSSTSAFLVNILADLWALETFVHHQMEILPKFIQGQSFLFHIVITRCEVLFHLLPGTLHGGRA